MRGNLAAHRLRPPFSPSPRTYGCRGRAVPLFPVKNRCSCLPVTPAYPTPPLCRRYRGDGRRGGHSGGRPVSGPGCLSAPAELEDGQQDSQHPHPHPNEGDGQPASAGEEHPQHKGGDGRSQVGAEVKQPYQSGDGAFSPAKERGIKESRMLLTPFIEAETAAMSSTSSRGSPPPASR